MATLFKLKVATKKRLTPNAVEIGFVVPDENKDDFQFKAGQYLSLQTEIDGKKVRRAYSISSSPCEGSLTVGIKKIPNGLFSSFANDVLSVGDELEVLPPEGKFVLSDSPKQDVIAFAAGSGITPIISILKEHLAANDTNRFCLVYGNQSPKETMYLSELKELAVKYPNRFFIQWVFSRVNDAMGVFGRIDNSIANLALKNKFKEFDFGEAFLCGPQEMVAELRNNLLGNGFTEEQIKHELFTASVEDENAGNGNEAVMKVLLDDEEHELTVKENETLLDAALREDLDAPYSCQGGVCSSCVARVTEGSATMKVNQILTDSEIAEGLILTCQAQPTSDSISIDYDEV